jgi:serpin B
VRGLDEARWNEILDGLAPTELDMLWLPRFSLSYDTYLNKPLKDMGMGVAFDGAADFSRLSPLGEDMCISFVRQKTFMEVDEAGTRAAAATGVGVGAVSLGPALVADRPFLLAIRERLSGTVLFAGWIGDPTAEEPEAPLEPNDCR